VRYLSGVFVACPCVKKCQQELQGTEYLEVDIWFPAS
jgi:hypothetical protein